MSDQSFDIVIAGCGIGGLVCAELLRKEGYSVCILEQNAQIGGALQVFARNKTLFDSGVHYIGGCAPGQNLYKIFNYLGLMDKLDIQPYDAGAFDCILIEGDTVEYPLAQGYDRFIESLTRQFPEEREGIIAYCEMIQDICSRFPMYNLIYEEDNTRKLEVMGIDTETYIASIIGNETLRAVLGGNNILYAGVGQETPLYVHALIQNSYIESAWRCAKGGAQISTLLAKQFRAGGGVIKTRSRVQEFVEQDGIIDCVLLENGTKISGRYFISNIHPARTLSMIGGHTIRPVFRNRVEGLRNTIGCFTVYAVLTKKTVPFRNSNFYYHRQGKLWTMVDYVETEWPLGYALFFSPDADAPEWAESVSIITYMRYEEVARWGESHNTVTRPSDRPAGYAEFKADRAKQLLDLVEEKFPGISSHIQASYTSTPLTFRDYLGDDTGSMYGILKDYRNSFETHISAKTRIKNLFFTGQNLNLHGILGTTISALMTVRELTGNNAIIDAIRNANQD